MSDIVNPYQSPETAAVPVKPLTAQGMLTETMLIYLKGASPWLRFAGILGFISAGLTILSSLSFFTLIPVMNQVGAEVPGFAELEGALGIVFSGSMAAFCIGTGVLTFFPSLFIYRFGEKIRSYLRSGADQDLEQAFKNNKSLWKFAGIICIISLAFIPLMIIAGIIVAVVASI